MRSGEETQPEGRKLSMCSWYYLPLGICSVCGGGQEDGATMKKRYDLFLWKLQLGRKRVSMHLGLTCRSQNRADQQTSSVLSGKGGCLRETHQKP